MLRPRDALVCGLLVWGCASTAAPPSAAAAVVLGESGSREAGAAQSGRKLTGRFLHITDFHPDPFYKTYSSTTAETACHRKRGPAGIYGAETSGCDSPFSLVNETFRWIKDNIRDDIDFVIWTGDSARHDNDEKHARTQKQIISQNEFLVEKFAEVFGVSDKDRRGTNDYVIPIVPTFGNNDIMPHNIFLQGPNKWTMKYLDIWRSFIPEAQRHQFQQGGWFSVEVIPGRLAVISLNTIYFFTSNSGVDGCANKHEPGYEHMEWLRIQLKIMRERGIKAILMGHVPPARVDSKESWDETCWQKYTLWVQQYRDVIVGSLYGHMNIDHFMLQDFEQINGNTRKGDMAAQTRAKSVDGEISLLENGEVTVASASDYLLSLRAFWAQLPSPLSATTRNSEESEIWIDDDDSIWSWLMSTLTSSRSHKKIGKSAKKKYLEKIGGKYAQRYSASLVTPSVVPNYYPTLRIVEYNITGLEHINAYGGPEASWEQSTLLKHEFSDDEGYQREVDTLIKRKERQKKKERAAKHSKKFRFKVPEGPSKSAPPGPAYSPQTFTLTRYVQYFANLTRINNDFVDPQHHKFDTDEAPVSANALVPRTIFGLQVSESGEIEGKGWKEGKHGKHNGKHPRPEPHPKEFEYEVEYDTKDMKFPDLTVRRWVEYARKIGGGGKKSASLTDLDHNVDEIEFDVDESNDEGLEAEGKKHKKHKKGKKHRKASKEWFTFVKHAFVGTMDPHEIKQVFGHAASGMEESQEEITEL
ncbi:Metallo-dependent phosphatase-like protein [Boeremia exigua]|uniref:Metallo-dependent phosphatase-like protein n=1 Tax=Boeremia exigua TaxID=749465 RepID=UPI001E8D3EB2|nr:Metallo-dependent phosphatase-like protein [Boeremia exigua]KAH6615029.1 Metallo-dependent phosphatase-like protein [Boeremia exigua]